MLRVVVVTLVAAVAREFMQRRQPSRYFQSKKLTTLVSAKCFRRSDIIITLYYILYRRDFLVAVQHVAIGLVACGFIISPGGR
jgi:hypothetical protein